MAHTWFFFKICQIKHSDGLAPSYTSYLLNSDLIYFFVGIKIFWTSINIKKKTELIAYGTKDTKTNLTTPCNLKQINLINLNLILD